MIPEENWPAPPETPVEGAAAAALTPADVFTGENDANDDESDARSEKPEEPEDNAEATPMDTDDKSTDVEAGDVLETPPKFPTLPESWECNTSGTKRPASEASTVLGEDEDSGEPLQKKSTGMWASAAAKPAAVAKPAAAAKRAAAAKSKGRGSGSSGGAPARGGGRGGKATAPGGEAMRAALAAGSRSRRAKAA